MQPIYNEDKSKAVIFNGEIYNYQGIREELINKGHTFTTETDTEVLLHGFEEWGMEILSNTKNSRPDKAVSHIISAFTALIV
jgi:asparagine synthase (glutamine-hydrolysing)